MKKCKIYSTEKKAEADAVIIGNRVFILWDKDINTPPAYVDENEQCYYPPYHAAPFTRELEEGLIPFSLVCKWEDFKDFYSNEWNVPNWIIQILGGVDSIESGDDYLENIYVSDEKWGYCDAKTGEIKVAPLWEWCSDLYDDGYAVVKANRKYGVSYWGGDYAETDYDIYDEILSAGDGIFLVRIDEKWGAINAEGSTDFEYYEVPYEWDGIWWDGYGGYTVMRKIDGREIFGIAGDKEYARHNDSNIVIFDLTEKPQRYESPDGQSRINSYRDSEECVKFRIIQRENKYGLVIDNNNGRYSSKLRIKPEHTYELILDGVNKADLEAEIEYYAHLITSTQEKIPGCIEIWNHVPLDIKDSVRAYMGNLAFEREYAYLLSEIAIFENEILKESDNLQKEAMQATVNFMKAKLKNMEEVRNNET